MYDPEQASFLSIEAPNFGARGGADGSTAVQSLRNVQVSGQGPLCDGRVELRFI
jgi:hypothetical protein